MEIYILIFGERLHIGLGQRERGNKSRDNKPTLASIKLFLVSLGSFQNTAGFRCRWIFFFCCVSLICISFLQSQVVDPFAPSPPALKTKNDSKDHFTDTFYFSKSVAPCLRYLVVAMIPKNKNCKPRTSMDSLRLLHGPLRSIFFVTQKLSNIREPGKVLQAGSWRS